MAMNYVFRCYVEKKPGFDVEAQKVFHELRDQLGIQGLTGLRLLNRYDAEGLDYPVYLSAKNTVFAEPQVDEIYDEALPKLEGEHHILAVEALPGQYDQRADSCAQCIMLLAGVERPTVKNARVYVLFGQLCQEDLDKIRGYLINPVECREAVMDKPATLAQDYSAPAPVAVLEGFTGLDEDGLARLLSDYGLAMDLADLMAVLYGEVMKFDPKNPRWEDRDWLVLSKGHAGPVAYATFGLMGYYPMEEAYTLNHPHTKFPSHTDRKLTPGVDLTTGSLGQGASTATGAALGNKIDGRDSHVFCVIGDGEADEGQVWEAFHFAYAHKLDNIIYFIDNNGYQLDGPTADILDHGNIAKKAESFGLYTQEIDGHDVKAIYDAIQNAYAKKGVPSCIVLDTCKGKGATFAEPKHDHSSQPNEEQWAEALAAAEKALEDAKNA